MEHVYAVAFMTVDDTNPDLYVETVIAESPEAAIGKSMLDGQGNKAMHNGDGIVAVNVAEQDNADVADMMDRIGYERDADDTE